jgi:endonuclease/exonuclease/phosphatase family metal-dependent hydrolase
MKATKAKSSKRPQKIRELRVLSYNIHQGITVDRSKLEFELLRSTLESLQADIILLQEVAGRTSGRGKDPYRIDISHQMESLVGKIWPYHAYQKNVVFTKRFHGNAILSRFPILKWNLINITVKSLKKRGVLHGEIEIPGLKKPLHVFTAHLGLLQYERFSHVFQISSKKPLLS